MVDCERDSWWHGRLWEKWILIFSLALSPYPIHQKRSPNLHLENNQIIKFSLFFLFIDRSTRQASLDGAYFGTTFSHLFLLLYSEVFSFLMRFVIEIERLNEM